MIRKLLANLVLKVPEKVEPHHRRFCQVMTFINVLSAAGHFSFIPLFYMLGVTPLVLYNFFSVTLFMMTFSMNRHGWHYVAMVLMVAEYTGHAALSVHYVGWQFGFQYYMFGWAFIPFFAPPGKKLIKLGLFFVSCASLVLLYNYSVGRPVLDTWNSNLVTGINAVNITFNSAVLTLGFVYFRVLVDAAEEKLEREYERSEELIRNMLPDKIASRLKDHPKSVADSFTEVSVLFVDIVSFTPLAESLVPNSVVRMLNDIFSKLDAIAEELGLEKIKTIGDAYMVAAGIPESRPDHTQAIGRFALAAESALAGYEDRNGDPMKFRIGISAGPVVAGVIGTKKFSYDLWGDTVNTAASMESHGVSGHIQCTRAYRELAKKYFEFTRRGLIEIKGKGELETYFLVGESGAPSTQIDESDVNSAN